MKLRCIIADDEPLARQILETYVEDHLQLERVKSCKNAMEVLEVLQVEKVDVLFLDINMPKLSGMSLLKTLQNPPHIIITTAYTEYAVQAYEFSVVDYLLKPISFERFTKAIGKITQMQAGTAMQAPHSFDAPPSKAHIFVRSDTKIVKVSLTEITLIEAYGNYVKVYLIEGKPIVTKKTLSDFEAILPEEEFMRVHRSFIVSLQKIQSIEGNTLQIDQKVVPISRPFKSPLFEKLGVEEE